MVFGIDRGSWRKVCSKFNICITNYLWTFPDFFSRRHFKQDNIRGKYRLLLCECLVHESPSHMSS